MDEEIMSDQLIIERTGMALRSSVGKLEKQNEDGDAYNPGPKIVKEEPSEREKENGGHCGG